ncbi:MULTISPECIES: FAD:protein FMN transferase [unclassified Streptomyces]|uniref:FAD:protein FMN transferase n=1 Tax=unclassified Streptomyces TaxID=2593676 RepID=UPI0016567CE6|nr:FAD:protein FMN transferase [Streptomyces sp. CB02980]MCB8902061.1 FAD:protein FMN transferase [Streptomyces sp. CB02980]
MTLAAPAAAPRARFAFEGIGTPWQVLTGEPLPEEVRTAVLDCVEGFDSVWSRFRPDSLVSRIAASPGGGRFVFPDDATVMFDLYDRLGAATGGAVDPLVGRRLEELGYDATYTFRPALTPEAYATDAWSRERPLWTRDVRRDGPVLTTRRPLVLDVGAAGKGRLVDLVAGILRRAGIRGYVVDGSGDLAHAGDTTRTSDRPLRVGLEHPDDPTRVIGVARLYDLSLCASATNRRRWGPGLHHLLDARTGQPVHDTVATWTVADDTATADGLATALFLTGPDRLAEHFDFSWVRLGADGRLDASADFDGELFA